MKYRWIFEQFFGIFSVFHEPLDEWNTEKIPKNYENIHRYFIKTHGITGKYGNKDSGVNICY